MSSRRPRARFAAPLVVTLAMAPACVVHTGTSTPPPRTGGTTDDHRTVDAPPPGPIMNPPRPIDAGGPTPPPKQPDPVTDVVQADPNQQAPQPAPTTWTVSMRVKDKVCYAMLDVQCPPPPSTCNPPPARKLASCPDGVTATNSLKIQEQPPGSCFVIYPTPACPAGMACNPPRPAKIDCPH